MEWYEYLNILIKQKDIRQSEISATLNVTDSHVSNIFNGKAYPSEELLEKIFTFLEMNDNERDTFTQLFLPAKMGKNSLLLKHYKGNLYIHSVMEVTQYAWMRLKKNLETNSSEGTVYTTIQQSNLYATQNPVNSEIYIIDRHRQPAQGNTVIVYNNTIETPQVGKFQHIGTTAAVITGDGDIVEMRPPYEILGVVLEKHKIEKYV